MGGLSHSYRKTVRGISKSKYFGFCFLHEVSHFPFWKEGGKYLVVWARADVVTSLLAFAYLPCSGVQLCFERGVHPEM